MVKCPFAVPTCKCYDCACNASYDECNHGYCITCFECLNESKAVPVSYTHLDVYKRQERDLYKTLYEQILDKLVGGNTND